MTGIAVEGCQVGGDGLPLLPAAGGGHVQRSEQLTAHAVQPYLYLSAAQSAGHACREGSRHLVAQVYVLQLDVVAVVDVGDVDAQAVLHLGTLVGCHQPLLGLHALGEGHGLGLHAAVGVELGHGLHALAGGQDGGEGAVVVVLELLDGHATPEAAAAGQLTRMVEEVGVTLVVGHAAVVGERACVAERHDFAGVCPRSRGVGRRAVGDMFGHAAGGIQQAIRLPIFNL